MDVTELEEQLETSEQSVLESVDLISNSQQFLMFKLGKEGYAVDILCVEEIRRWEQPTKIPNAPEYIKGVINIRGLIVPIIDFRLKFTIGQGEYLNSTVVIVLTINNENNCKTIGVVVDAVSDVIDVEEQDFTTESGFIGNIPQENVQGLVNINDNVVTVLNANTLLKLEH